MAKVKYKAALYLRLSKEDGDKVESDSIINQRDLGMDFLSKHPDISLVCELADDGYTGSNFDRPNFRKMIDLITKGKVNCVIVKDLSRFARDYIGAGYYLEKLFPSLGVRFISINDNIDYKVDNGSNTQLIMGIKNIMNDAYIHDISVKIRSQFEIKRKKGEYIGAFVVYGYKKSSEDKHKLVVDEYAAEIVKDIFNKRMQGLSAVAIAEKLNLLNAPSPAEYKKQCGSKFHPNLQKNYIAKWSAKAIIRILTNEIYTGTLIQGKHTTVNHKVKKLIEKEQSQWVVIPESHEAIITQEQFDIVQKLIKQDTRVNPGNKQPYLFSGFLKCADCGDSMIRRTAKYHDKTYAYYMCSRNKLGYGCSSHRVKEDVLYASVLTAINSYCKNVSDLSKRLNAIPFSEIEAAKVAGIERSKQEKSEEIVDLQRTMEIVENRCKNLLESRESCNEICADIRLSIKKLETEIRLLNDEKANITQEIRRNRVWIKFFTENGDLKELNRTILANLIDEILVHEDKRIVIRFNYQDKYMQLLEIEGKLNMKEAV